MLFSHILFWYTPKAAYACFHGYGYNL